MLSYWQQSAWFNHTDIAIIGSGIVGLNAAIHIKRLKPALRVSLFEKGPIPAGASSRNAGFATFGSVSELLDDLSKQPSQQVWELAKKRFSGLQLLRKSLGDEAMRYEALGGYEVFNSADEFERYGKHLPEINEALHAFAGLRDTFSISEKTNESFGFKGFSGFLFNQHEGLIHSGMMLKALIQKAREIGVELFYGFDLNSIEQENGTALLRFKNPELSLKCGTVLICTNGFAGDLIPDLDLKPARGLVLVTESIQNLKMRGAFHHNKGYDYFRHIEDRVLLGGGRNLDIDGETSTADLVNPKILDYLKTLLYEQIIPGINVKVEFTWTGTMGVGQSKEPIIKKVGESLYCAVRMGGMGVALGSQTGLDAAELLMNDFT